MVNLLMDGELNSVCGAGCGERSDERVSSRNRLRSRPWDTRVCTINLQIPAVT
jgi:putative transposase